MALLDNLVEYWKFEGNSNGSVNGNNGADTSISYGTAYGKIGQGLLAGAGSQIIVNQHSTINDIFQTGGSFLVSFYLTGTPGTNSHWIAGKGYEGYWDCGITAASGATFKLRFVKSFSTLRGRWQNSNFDFTTNTWYQFLVTYDASSLSNDPIFYVNGASVAITEMDTPAGSYQSDNSATVPRLVLAALNDSPNPSLPWAGNLDEIALWKRIVTPAEALVLANGGRGITYPFNPFPTLLRRIQAQNRASTY